MKQKMNYAGTVISKEDWNQIYSYYYNTAPIVLLEQVFDTTGIFDANYNLEENDTADTISDDILLLSCSKKGGFYYGTQEGFIYHKDGDISTLLASGIDTPVDLHEHDDGSLSILSMGSLGPTHEAPGSVWRIYQDATILIIDSLHRPINMLIIEGDEGQYLISSFGSTNDSLITGDLSLFRPDAEGYQRVLISSLAGSSKTKVVDIEGDGTDEIVSLFAQGDERISVFRKNDDGEYQEEVLIRAHPLYGTLDFDLADLDDDGDLEIITANGDNADYSVVFKPYHGLRIYSQDSGGEFVLKKFFPINGASQVMLQDFDNDNLIDIGVFSLYPNLKTRPWEIFQIFENRGDLSFQRSAFSEVEGSGWVRCAICDGEDPSRSKIIFGANRNINKVLRFGHNGPTVKEFSLTHQ